MDESAVEPVPHSRTPTQARGSPRRLDASLLDAPRRPGEPPDKAVCDRRTEEASALSTRPRGSTESKEYPIVLGLRVLGPRTSVHCRSRRSPESVSLGPRGEGCAGVSGRRAHVCCETPPTRARAQ